MKPRFSIPNDQDLQRLAGQWRSVSKLVEEEFNVELDQSRVSLDLLQRVLDEDLIGNNEYGLRCLGVAFGRIVVKCVEGLDWWIVEDEIGRDPCLRYRQTTFRINPLTMISKRVLNGEQVNMSILFSETNKLIQQIAPTAD